MEFSRSCVYCRGYWDDYAAGEKREDYGFFQGYNLVLSRKDNGIRQCHYNIRI
jgi:hypothetical protein